MYNKELYKILTLPLFINKVKIRVDDNTRDLDYLGNKSYGVNLPIELIGLKKGLEEIYNAL